MSEKNPIELFPPEEIKDKNTLFGWAIRTLRNVIGQLDEYEGELKPLGDIELMPVGESARFVGLKQSHELHRYIREYNKAAERRIESVNDLNWGKVYLVDDLKKLKAWLDIRKGRLDPSRIVDYDPKG